MKERRLLYFALGVLTIASFGGANPLALTNDGIQFPDGSLQTTAAANVDPGEPIHDETFLTITDTQFCSPFTILLSVPVGKFLIIEWVGIESNAVTQADPVDIDILTDDGTTGISHSIVRLDNSEQTAGSFFFSQRWSSQVRLYSAGNENVEGQACRDGDINDHSVRISLYGRLFDNPGP